MAFQGPDLANARQLLRELAAAIEKPDFEASARLVTRFRETVTTSAQQFALALGVDARTVRRWETPADKKTPPLLKVRTWERLFALDREQGTGSEDTELLPVANGNLPGVFHFDDIAARIADAEKIYALKSRAAFRASSTPAMLELFVRKFRTEAAFRISCAWIKPDNEVDNTRNLFEVRPARISRDSFIEFRKSVLAAEKDAEDKIVAYELSLAEAATCGLADSPASLLVIQYKDSVRSKYQRKVDVFIEIVVGMYHEKTLQLTGIPEARWILVDPPLALEYYNRIWPLDSYTPLSKSDYVGIQAEIDAAEKVRPRPPPGLMGKLDTKESVSSTGAVEAPTPPPVETKSV